MKLIDKIWVYKTMLQIGVIDSQTVVDWVNQQILVCNDDEPALIILSSLTLDKGCNQLIHSIVEEGIDFNYERELELIKELLRLVHTGSDGVSKVAHTLEHLENLEITTFSDKAAYFKCTIEDIEDIEADIYGNIEELQVELIDYLERKKNPI